MALQSRVSGRRCPRWGAAGQAGSSSRCHCRRQRPHIPQRRRGWIPPAAESVIAAAEPVSPPLKIKPHLRTVPGLRTKRPGVAHVGWMVGPWPPSVQPHSLSALPTSEADFWEFGSSEGGEISRLSEPDLQGPFLKDRCSSHGQAWPGPGLSAQQPCALSLPFPFPPSLPPSISPFLPSLPAQDLLFLSCETRAQGLWLHTG